MNQFRLTTPHSLKEQRDKGVRLGEVFSMSHLYFKYYNAPSGYLGNLLLVIQVQVYGGDGTVP